MPHARSGEVGDAAWRDYTRLLLTLYDPFVVGPIARFVWRCPSPLLVDEYRRRIRAPHLDIGPGTGYFIDRSGLPDGSDVTIVDPNRNVLRHATRRLARLNVRAIEASVLQALPVSGPFGSAALHLVLHCLPGPTERKAAAVANVAATLAPGGVLFGATVLGTSGDHSWLARRILWAFNRRGAFDNLGDSVDGLRAILEASFDQVDLTTIGSIATFVATKSAAP
ncbi:MAG TPA: class I SAM-dependent methyltransferase [Candidatus Limnocylindrales bacterium]